MWCISKGPDMMGLPTNNKRKSSNDGGCMSPAKQCRTEELICPSSPVQQVMRPSRLEELASVAPPDWAAQRPPLITTLLDDDDDEFDDDDFDDDDDETDTRCRYSEQTCFSKPACFEDARSGPYWGSPQQTIRCEENGKSYLELGPSPTSARSNNRTPSACCDGERTSWCRRAPETTCYRQRRLAVFNLSMCKLGRYRQFTDPSLLRSVLICNTLRYIEREMEQEGCFYGPCVPPAPFPPTPSPAEVDPTFPPPQFLEVPDITPSTTVSYRAGPEFYEQSGRATPFPTLNNDTDSGMGDDENAKSINWGSVLSLSSQSDLDPMNNNELYSSGEDTSREFDDFLPNWKLSSSEAVTSLPSCQVQQQAPEMELMQVLVSS